ncbi:MAG TPA: malonate transporter, partial [Pseudomonas sp.]|nr:malonate transporter [Pseudomonas sp.]
GVAAVALAFALVPVLDRIGRKKLEAAPSDPSDPVDQAKPLTSSARG